MSDSPRTTTIALEGAVSVPGPETEEVEETTLDETNDQAAAPEKLDNPIERADLAPSETFIPEAVDQLLAHSRRYPLLTPAQEIELAKRIERGDLHAKELLVNSNLRLVASNARRYQNQGLPLGDLVQEGMLGLIRAVEKFDWAARIQVLDLRDAVDPPGHSAWPPEPRTDHPGAGARIAAAGQGAQDRVRPQHQART
jgi:DNA-directed RNA polymerase sigma subunit (sigma70/sigma32)